MKKKKPEIRFNGFEGEWVSYAFRFLFTEKRDTTQEEFEDQLLSCAIDGIYLNSELFNHFRGSTTIGYLKVKRYDLILSAQNLHLGNANVNLRFASGIISPAYKVYTINGDDPYFINAWVKSEHAKNFFMSATTEGASLCRKNIEWEFLYDKKICVPSLSEQEKIGLFLTTLDKLIAKLEAKLDKLRKLKQALLEKMFVNVNGGGYETPEIRFKGYTDKWLTTTLGACSKKIITKNNDNEYNIVLTNSAERGIVDQRSYFDREIVNTENIQGYYIVSQDDFVYNPRISMQAPVGPINRSKIEYTGVMSPLYYVFRITDKRFSLTYLEWFFKSSSWHDFMYKNGNSGARSDRFSINDDAFLRLPIYHPKDISEQEQIGKCFTQIDTHFNKTSTKLTKLRNIKQSLLQKMFA